MFALFIVYNKKIVHCSLNLSLFFNFYDQELFLVGANDNSLKKDGRIFEMWFFYPFFGLLPSIWAGRLEFQCVVSSGAHEERKRTGCVHSGG